MWLRRIESISLVSLIFLAITLAYPATASAGSVQESVLYSFQGTPDGFSPIGRLATDEAGNLYGVTEFGGTLANGCGGQCGIVFELSPPSSQKGAWTETVIYDFQGVNIGDGDLPGGGLIRGRGGKLYGATAYGGSGSCVLLGGHVGCGTVYELTPPAVNGGAWTENVIYSFQGGNDGCFAVGELVADKEGNLYGATRFGGGFGVCDFGIYPFCGTVFKLSPPAAEGGAWTEQVLYSFKSGTDGAEPNGGLALDSRDALYGTTNFGGNSGCNVKSSVGCGTIFKLTPPCQRDGTWRERVLYRFPPNLLRGADPASGLILNKNGNLYGTTYFGGGGSSVTGVVFELSPPSEKIGAWRINVLHSFTNSDGNEPNSGMIFDNNGSLYGTAHAFGKYGGGTVFRLKPPTTPGGTWIYGVLHAFAGPPDGAVPRGLTFCKGGIYGLTSGGGIGTNCFLGGCGTVYEIIH